MCICLKTKLTFFKDFIVPAKNEAIKSLSIRLYLENEYSSNAFVVTPLSPGLTNYPCPNIFMLSVLYKLRIVIG